MVYNIWQNTVSLSLGIVIVTESPKFRDSHSHRVLSPGIVTHRPMSRGRHIVLSPGIVTQSYVQGWIVTVLSPEIVTKS